MKSKDVGRILPETDLAYECLSSDGRGGKADRDGIECSERHNRNAPVGQERCGCREDRQAGGALSDR